MFSCEFFKNFKNTFFTDHLWKTATASVKMKFGLLLIQAITNISNFIFDILNISKTGE